MRAQAKEKNNCDTEIVKLFDYRFIYNIIRDYNYSYKIISSFSK